jgi:hypothetical protein
VFVLNDLPPENDTRYNIVKGELEMPKKANTPEQIIYKLREAEILLSQGNTIGGAFKKRGVSD